MTPSPAEHLPIRTVARLTGVNPITLRAWERRYGLIEPQRTPTGHRLYTHQHVEQIRRVIAMVGRGIPISRATDLLAHEVQAPATEGASGGPWLSYQQRMEAAIARFDEPELDQIYDEALSIHSVERIHHALILPLLTHLGSRWEAISGAIAEEHFFACYLRSKLGARLQHRMRFASGPRLVVACAPGEHHEIGLLLFAIEAHGAGLRTVVLGANTPLEELGVALQRSGGDALVISSSIDPAQGLLERDLPQLVRTAAKPVFVGGATALRQRAALHAAGAVPLGVDVPGGIALIKARLVNQEKAP